MAEHAKCRQVLRGTCTTFQVENMHCVHRGIRACSSPWQEQKGSCSAFQKAKRCSNQIEIQTGRGSVVGDDYKMACDIVTAFRSTVPASCSVALCSCWQYHQTGLSKLRHKHQQHIINIKEAHAWSASGQLQPQSGTHSSSSTKRRHTPALMTSCILSLVPSDR